METYIFVTIYILVSTFAISNSFHLKRVKRIIENVPEDLHNVSGKNESDIHSATKLYENVLSGPLDAHLNVTSTRSSSEKMNNYTTSTGRNEHAPSNNISTMHQATTETNTCEKPIKTMNRHQLAGKPSTMKNPALHPKGEPVNHSMWHKNYKDWHKFGPVNNAHENNLNRIDVVLVDVQPIYKVQEKQRLYTRNPPPLRYAPMNPSSSILDIFFGLNPFSTEFLTEPAENEFYFQDRFLTSPWNRRPSFSGIVKPDILLQEELNGYKDRNDVNAAQLVGQKSEVKNCTCGERN